MKKSSIIWLAIYFIVASILIVWMAYLHKTSNVLTAKVNNDPLIDTTMGKVDSKTMNPLTLNVREDSRLGSYLAATNGMTLYSYAKDTSGVSNCSGVCAVNWPPYEVASSVAVFGGPKISGKISTILRDGSKNQVTYNGAPLYFWKGDANPGDTAGQNVGGVWFTVRP